MSTLPFDPSEGLPPVFKDSDLGQLASGHNVAQFVSFDPELRQRHLRLKGYADDHVFRDCLEACEAVRSMSHSGQVNVRSFKADVPSGNPFIYGISTARGAKHALQELAASGYYTIVNETIDIEDGGVSGVLVGECLEFAPKETPRCVEGKGIARLPTGKGLKLLETVYGFAPKLQFGPGSRVEFSVHPQRQGLRDEHTVVWEVQQRLGSGRMADVRWPNPFSRFIGDKAYGLLVAHTFGLPVPRTTVISRSLAPFSFGEPTGCFEKWLRTCPAERIPGKLPTYFGWRDPTPLFDDREVVSVLSQDSVDPAFSGAASVGATGWVRIEGVEGAGNMYMLGRVAPMAALPEHVEFSVRNLVGRIPLELGSVEFEWVYDGRRAWIVQLRSNASNSRAKITAQEDRQYVRFDVSEGLDALRKLAGSLSGGNVGVVLVGNVGLNSHMAQVLLDERIASYIESPDRPKQADFEFK